MKMTDDIERIAAGLTKAQRAAMLVALPCWFSASAVGWRGNTMSALADKGLLYRASDPSTWGRSLYRLNGLGLAILARLTNDGGR